MVPTRSRTIEVGKEVFTYQGVEDVARAWKEEEDQETKLSQTVTLGTSATQQKIPDTISDLLLSSTLYYNPTKHVLAYKKVTRKIHLVATTMLLHAKIH